MGRAKVWNLISNIFKYCNNDDSFAIELDGKYYDNFQGFEYDEEKGALVYKFSNVKESK